MFVVTEADIDRDAWLVRDAALLLIRGDVANAAKILRRVDAVRVARPPRPRPGQEPPILPDRERVRAIGRERAVAVFRRDHWACCYCGRLLVHANVLEHVARLVGDVFPWVSHHMPKAGTHPAIERLYPNVEHVLPLARGGDNSDENVRACCTPCNEWKGDCTPEEASLTPQPVGAGWDGLEPLLVPLRAHLTHT